MTSVRAYSGLRSLLHASVGMALFIAPFLIAFTVPRLGTRRGVWVTLAGVLVAVVVERGIRPFFLNQHDWMKRTHWILRALPLAILLGLLASVGDAFAREAGLRAVVMQIWIPLYRSILFACGLTLLRRFWNEQDHAAPGIAGEAGTATTIPGDDQHDHRAMTVKAVNLKSAVPDWGCSRCLAVGAGRVHHARRHSMGRTDLLRSSPRATVRAQKHHSAKPTNANAGLPRHPQSHSSLPKA